MLGIADALNSLLSFQSRLRDVVEPFWSRTQARLLASSSLLIHPMFLR